MGKMTFILGAGIGFVIGTRAGRSQYERMRAAAAKIMENPGVRGGVGAVEHRVNTFMRDTGTAVTDKVANLVKEAIVERTQPRIKKAITDDDVFHGRTG